MSVVFVELGSLVTAKRIFNSEFVETESLSEPGEVTERTFPDPATLAIMAQGRFDVRTTVDAPDPAGD